MENGTENIFFKNTVVFLLEFLQNAFVALLFFLFERAENRYWKKDSFLLLLEQEDSAWISDINSSQYM